MYSSTMRTTATTCTSIHDRLLNLLHSYNTQLVHDIEMSYQNSNTIIGPYRIIKDLGEGSFSKVKLAVDQNSKNDRNGLVALKFIPLASILTQEPSIILYLKF